ncbi:vitrin isoform X1 [Lates japonicus]|uniref:Vitrin isoform X1 n=1 Tax=Lates japonicus TaxID=270547 RepID=A0AAD3NJ71_LATJO|nr:vitrin isoform X1 [Lates japonicus]
MRGGGGGGVSPAWESGINIFFVTIEGPDDNLEAKPVEANFVDKVGCCQRCVSGSLQRTCLKPRCVRLAGGCAGQTASSPACGQLVRLRKITAAASRSGCVTRPLVCSKTFNANLLHRLRHRRFQQRGHRNFRTGAPVRANVTPEFGRSLTRTRGSEPRQHTHEQRLEFAGYNHKAEPLNAIKRINY